MKIIEQFVQSRSGDAARCEDMIVLTDDFLAVLDGATDEGGAEIDGMPSGLFAAKTLAGRLDDMPGDADAGQALRFLSQALLRGEEKPHAQCDVIIFSVARKEVWRVGTVHLLLDSISYPPTRRIDEITSAGRAAYNQALLLSGTDIEEISRKDPGRERMLPLMRMQRFFANEARSEWGYGVVNGEEIPSFFLEIFPAESCLEIVFASDGYPQALPSLGDSESALELRLRDDPLRLRQPPGTQGLRPGDVSFDDRAYLRFQP